MFGALSAGKRIGGVMEETDRLQRILGIYTKLVNGYAINKEEEANRYHVSKKTVERDIDAIRNFLLSDMEENGFVNDVVYDRRRGEYLLESMSRLKFSNSEVLAICKILLDSRAFTKEEMTGMLNKLIGCCVPSKNQKLITDLIRNEEFHYVELQHKTIFIDRMWEIGQAIRESRYIEITYRRTKDKETVKRKLKPVAIMFSEYYFYLAAFIEGEEVKKDFAVPDDPFPTIYRIDRITAVKVSEERFHIPYKSKFQEGEFRKRIQFMYGGELQEVEFVYAGASVESVLDRLPTASIVNEEDGKYTVKAQVFGKGIEMWIRSQGDAISGVKYRKC